jgi:hypothetical protein
MRQLHYLFAASLVLVSSAALAQGKYDTAPLPAICTKGAMTAMGGMTTDSSAGAMAMPTDEAHKALAAGKLWIARSSPRMLRRSDQEQDAGFK